jgi:hypothetical protein
MPDQIPLHVHRDGPDDPLVVHVEHWPKRLRIDAGLLRQTHPSTRFYHGDRLKLTVDNGRATYRVVGLIRDDWVEVVRIWSQLQRSTL